jgi:hypothetical protein
VEAVDILLKGTMSWATMLKSSGCRADVREYTKAPALHPAAYHGHTEICSLLFNAGAEVRGFLAAEPGVVCAGFGTQQEALVMCM